MPQMRQKMRHSRGDLKTNTWQCAKKSENAPRLGGVNYITMYRDSNKLQEDTFSNLEKKHRDHT